MLLSYVIELCNLSWVELSCEKMMEKENEMKINEIKVNEQKWKEMNGTQKKWKEIKGN